MRIETDINDRLGALLDQKASEAGVSAGVYAAGVLENYLQKEAKIIFESKLQRMTFNEKEAALGKVEEVRQDLIGK